MKTMMIGICYTTDGTRYINEMLYTDYQDILEVRQVAEVWKHRNDEVYTIELNPTHKDFIQEIVLNGCRM